MMLLNLIALLSCATYLRGCGDDEGGEECEAGGE